MAARTIPAKTSNANAETFRERAETELADIRRVLEQIDQLAHDGQESTDPAMILSVIERLASDRAGFLHGEFWDLMMAALRRADGAAQVAHG